MPRPSSTDQTSKHHHDSPARGRARDRTRHRPSAALAPRPGDLIAGRWHALAAFARITAVTETLDGKVFDADAIQSIATSQQLAEDELCARWRAFRDYYVQYTEVVREREDLLRRVVECLAERHRDVRSRDALRLCRLRKPPLAKIDALVAESRRQDAERAAREADDDDPRQEPSRVKVG